MMKSVYLENGEVSVQEAAMPERKAGFATIRLMLGGICNTDLELQRGYYGFQGIPGHEFVGEVVEAETADWVGKRVVGEINLGCGNCGMCLRGLRRHCGARTVLGIVRHPGAFQEFFTLPEANLSVVPEQVTDAQAVFTEPLAAACEILDQTSIAPGTAVAVLGDGKLGLLIAQVLQAHGARVHQFGRHAEKLAISAKAGVHTEVTANLLPEREFAYVVDATGKASGLSAAIGMTIPRGTVIMKSTIHGAASFDAAEVIVNEITLVGSRCGRFQPALALLASGKVAVDEMIAGRVPLREAPRGFEMAARPGVLKVLLTN